MRILYQNLKQNFVLWLAKRLPPCKDITRLHSQSIVRTMTVREKIVIKLHLFICKACRNYLSNIEFIDEVFKVQNTRIEKGQLEIPLSPEASERIKKALRSSTVKN